MGIVHDDTTNFRGTFSDNQPRWSTFPRLAAPTAGQDLQKAHPTQGHPIQGRKGLPIRARKASIRPQAIRLWWSNEARFPQEGKDNQEGRVEIGMHSLQDKGTISVEAMQTLRVGW